MCHYSHSTFTIHVVTNAIIIHATTDVITPIITDVTTTIITDAIAILIIIIITITTIIVITALPILTLLIVVIVTDDVLSTNWIVTVDYLQLHSSAINSAIVSIYGAIHYYLGWLCYYFSVCHCCWFHLALCHWHSSVFYYLLLSPCPICVDVTHLLVVAIIPTYLVKCLTYLILSRALVLVFTTPTTLLIILALLIMLSASVLIIC